MVRLNDLLNDIQVVDTLMPSDQEISGISYHSGKCAPGHLFVCVTGYKTDGHRFLLDAVANGAAAAIVERFQSDVPIPQYCVANSRIALAQLGAAFYGQPAFKMKMIGITATNGKTTTSYMLNAILEHHGFKTGLIGTVVIKIDQEKIPAELTTPESLDLQRYLSEMHERGVSHVAMEVSSAAQETFRTWGVDYQIAAFNNLSREHIDSHGSFEQYFEAKSKLIRNAGADSVVVLNADDAEVAALESKTKAQVVTFAMKRSDSHIYCKDLDLSTGFAKYTLVVAKPVSTGSMQLQPTEFRVELAVPGLHSVYNSMSAAAMALLCGVSPEVVQEALGRFGGVERRFECIHKGDYTIFDDHFANPGNIDITLETLRYMNFEKLQLVYAIRGSRGPTVNRENAETIARWLGRLEINTIIATKSISHVTDKDVVTDEEMEVFLDTMKAAGIQVSMYDELPEAIAESLSRAGKGDLVLLAGCQGMDDGGRIALDMLNIAAD